MNDEVFREISDCLQDLPGGSGHLASFDLDASSFQILRAEDLGNGMTEIHFTVRGEYVSEFTEYGSDHPPRETSLNGRVILDRNLRVVRDEAGRPKLVL